MKRKLFGITLSAFFTLLALQSCKKNDDSASAKRNVKYEITGNFTGKLTVVYSDNVNGNTTINNVSLPWSKEIKYPSGVMTIGIGAQASTMGTPGQTATLKIYSDNTVVKTSSATAGSSGEMLVPTIAYGF